MAFSPDDFYGGPGTYNPAMGLLLVQHPELAASHLASLGREPPDDIPEGVDHVDAGHSLGRALAFNTHQGNPFDPGEQIMPDGRMPLVQEGPNRTDMPQFPTLQPPTDHPGIDTTAADTLQPPPRPRNPAAPPTPAPEAANATGAAPAGNTQDTPGQSVPLPRPKPINDQGDTGDTGDTGPHEEQVAADQGGKKKREPLDDLALALSGVRGMPTQNPLHIYSPQAPRPSNMIARSTVPQTLMSELAAAGHPATTFRLGEALRGKAGA